MAASPLLHPLWANWDTSHEYSLPGLAVLDLQDNAIASADTNFLSL